MDEFIEMIWKEVREHFGPATDVTIHVDAKGVTVNTESRAIVRGNKNIDTSLYWELARIDGEYVHRCD